MHPEVCSTFLLSGGQLGGNTEQAWAEGQGFAKCSYRIKPTDSYWRGVRNFAALVLFQLVSWQAINQDKALCCSRESFL